MTPLITNLIARGLVKRATSSGRTHPLQLTRKGEGLAAEGRKCMFEHDQTYFGKLGDQSRQQLIDFLSSIWREAPQASAVDSSLA